MSDCLFCKIIHGEIPTTKVYEDDQCLAFLDIAPLAPTHFLVVPKQHFASAAEATEENAAVIGHIYAVIAKIAKEQGFADGYRVVTNVGELAGQTVHHIHFHVLGLGSLTEPQTPSANRPGVFCAGIRLTGERKNITGKRGMAIDIG